MKTADQVLNPNHRIEYDGQTQNLSEAAPASEMVEIPSAHLPRCMRVSQALGELARLLINQRGHFQVRAVRMRPARQIAFLNAYRLAEAVLQLDLAAKPYQFSSGDLAPRVRTPAAIADRLTLAEALSIISSELYANFKLFAARIDSFESAKAVEIAFALHIAHTCHCGYNRGAADLKSTALFDAQLARWAFMETCGGAWPAPDTALQSTCKHIPITTRAVS